MFRAFPLTREFTRPTNLRGKVLYLRESIEMWGRGIGLIVNACEKARIAASKIYKDHGFIYTVFTRPTAQEWQNKVGEVNPPSVGTDKVDGTLKSTLNSTDRKIVELLADDGRISMVAISTRIGLSREGVRKAIKRLKDSRIIQRIGPAKGGHWEVCCWAPCTPPVRATASSPRPSTIWVSSSITDAASSASRKSATATATSIPTRPTAPVNS